jgi:hypothetical protein
VQIDTLLLVRQEMTQADLARLIGVPVTTLSNCLSQVRPSPADLRERALALSPGALAPVASPNGERSARR